jgi:hypothetical protein
LDRPQTFNRRRIKTGKTAVIQSNQLNYFFQYQIIKKQYLMNDPDVKQYIQSLIEPLYLKIQELDKEKNELKKRVGAL